MGDASNCVITVNFVFQMPVIVNVVVVVYVVVDVLLLESFFSRFILFYLFI